MRTIVLIFAMVLGSVFVSQAQNKTAIEVLYFKASLSCCQARACNQLEADVKKLINENFNDKDIAFKEIKLDEEANKALVEQYDAKSQTVVLVSTKRGKSKSLDISDIVRDYARTNNYDAFSKAMSEKIENLL
ncbi:MAG: hypothetical protein PHF99_01575 [Bacteroidales bacterium]|nr:hypothetical protein [Bacteroidales bacterium]